MSDADHIWDGNGGTLDPKTATQKDMLIALHVKMDMALRNLGDHETRMRAVERFQAKVIGAAATAAALSGAVTAFVVHGLK
jgi:hypothetical protein